MHKRNLKHLSRPARDNDIQETSIPQQIAKTLALADSPAWLQNNRHILTGYLPPDPDYLGVVASLTFRHNQTCNVYTHLIGALALPPLALAVAFYVSSPAFSTRVTATDYLVFGIFFAAAEFCLLASTAFHLLMNQSDLGHDFWLNFDLLGIVVVTVGSFVPGLYYGFFCERQVQRVHFALVGFVSFRWRFAGDACVALADLRK